MGPFQIVKDVHWAGALHPELRMFDDLMPTRRGTTYNSYLVRGQKTAVIDAVKRSVGGQLFQNVAAIVSPSEIDYIVINHAEPDHTGALAELLQSAPNARVFASKAASLFLRDLLNRPFECDVVENTAEVSLGGKTLRFIPAPFLHWPDTIFTYLVEDRILFTCDAFGTHFCDERMYNDLVGDFSEEFRQYYDTIVRPFRDKVLTAIERVKDLPIDMICPSHGPILRRDPMSYVQKYKEWATLKPRSKPYVAIIYTSAHGNTEQMAKAISDGIRKVGVEVDLLHITEVGAERIREAMENADGLLFGAPTIVRDIPPLMWQVLGLLSTVQVRAKRAAAFGSYGWSGEGNRFIEQRLRDMRLSVCESPLRKKFTPTPEDLAVFRAFGESFAADVAAG